MAVSAIVPILVSSLMSTAVSIVVPVAAMAVTPGSATNASTTKSPFIRVEGVSEKSMSRVQKAIESAAYGVDGKKVESPTTATGTPAIQESISDACDSFYMPPPKLRVTKKLPAVDPCSTLGNRAAALIADTDVQILFLCKEGVSVADYDFSMGRNGVGKRVLGDKKTPLGTYPLGTPRGSDLFKVFIPVGYPLKSQKQQGYTGSDIGIHGPSRPFRCAGFLNDSVNWTQGCIAVSSDIFIKEIGRFVQQNKIKEMTILPLETAR